MRLAEADPFARINAHLFVAALFAIIARVKNAIYVHYIVWQISGRLNPSHFSAPSLINSITPPLKEC